jgi:hypothetical protein
VEFMCRYHCIMFLGPNVSRDLEAHSVYTDECYAIRNPEHL